MSFVSPASSQPLFSSKAYASPELVPHPLGAVCQDKFGRFYRFCEVGGSDLVVGNAIQAPAQIADHQDMTPSVAALAARSISVTPGGTAGAADLYAQGIAVIDTTPGLGYSYPIKDHLAITASTLFVVNLINGFSVQVALTATSRVSLYSNPYRNVIQAPTTMTNGPVGVCQYILTTNEYGWLGSGGPFGTLIQGTPGVGLGVGIPGSTAGAVAIHAVATIACVGHMMDTGQDGKVEAVKWILN